MSNTALTAAKPAGQSLGARQIVRLVDNGLYIATALLFLVFSVVAPFFFSPANLLNIMVAASIQGVLVVGFTIALIGGLIDTSVVSVIAVASVLTGVLYQRVGLPLWLTILIAILAGVVMGLINGLIVINGRIIAFIATAATGAVFLGFSLALSNGQTIVITKQEFQDVLLVRFIGVPLSVWVMLLAYVAAYVMLNHTRLGAHLYAVGANYNSARLSGVPVDRVIRIGLVIMAALAALTAVIAMGRGSQTLLYGTTISGFDLTTTLAAVLLGGVSLFGGSGKIERNFVALIFLSIMANGLQLMGVSSGIWLIAKAILLVAAILLDVARQKAQ